MDTAVTPPPGQRPKMPQVNPSPNVLGAIHNVTQSGGFSAQVRKKSYAISEEEAAANMGNLDLASQNSMKGNNPAFDMDDSAWGKSAWNTSFNNPSQAGIDLEEEVRREKEKKAAAAEMQKLRDQVAALEKARAEDKARIDALEAENAQLKKQLGGIQTESDAEKATWMQQLEALQSEKISVDVKLKDVYALKEIFESYVPNPFSSALVKLMDGSAAVEQLGKELEELERKGEADAAGRVWVKKRPSKLKFIAGTTWLPPVPVETLRH